MEERYTAYHHEVTGRKMFARFRKNDPPMRPNKNGGLRPCFRTWTNQTVYWNIVKGMNISHQPVYSQDWINMNINDWSRSDQIAHPTQFYLRKENISKHIDVPHDGRLCEEVDDVEDINTVPIVFAFVYDDKYVVSTKRFDSLGEKSAILDIKNRSKFTSKNIDYIVYWRQEDADYVNSLQIETPMINFSLLSHLLIGGFQNLNDHVTLLDSRLKSLETKTLIEWKEAGRPAKSKPIIYDRNPDGTIDLSSTDEGHVMAFTLEAFFYKNYELVMNLSKLSLANLDELTNKDIGEKMLQTIFPLFSVLANHKHTHNNAPHDGTLTVVKNTRMHMFRLGHVFYRNMRGEFNIAEVKRKFAPFINHYFLMSAILDIENSQIQEDECIANGILFSKNPYTGHYETFNDMTCDGLVIGRSTHITLDSRFTITSRDTNIPSYVAVFFAFNFIFDGSSSEFARNATLSAFSDIDDKDLKLEEFMVMR